jgi:glycosyltransferase involved in cell wall biosynthesis
MKVAVLIPAFNLEQRIGELISRVKNYIPAEDVFVVDDGSTDRTGDEARTAGAHLLVHERNMGKGRALMTGFHHILAREYQGILTMDGDGQHDPASIPAFLDVADREDCDLIVGTRMSNVGTMPWIRILTNKTTSRIISILAGERIEDSQSGYRFHRTRLLREMTLVSENYDIESEILIRAARKGFKIGAIEIESIYTDEKSHINPLKDTLRFIALIFRSRTWKD